MNHVIYVKRYEGIALGLWPWKEERLGVLPWVYNSSTLWTVQVAFINLTDTSTIYLFHSVHKL
jgi:hypothetical protein